MVDLRARGSGQRAYGAIDERAAGVDMGRNIFQCDDQVAMIQAVSAMVHVSLKPREAFDRYLRKRR